jgi:hypothetical protein
MKPRTAPMIPMVESIRLPLRIPGIVHHALPCTAARLPWSVAAPAASVHGHHDGFAEEIILIPLRLFERNNAFAPGLLSAG